MFVYLQSKHGHIGKLASCFKKNKKKKINIDIFFPKLNTIQQFRNSNLLTNESYKTFNNAIFEDYYGNYITTKFDKKFVEKIGLSKTLQAIRSSILNFFSQEGLIGDRIFYVVNYFFYKINNKNKIINSNFFNTYTFICYDMYEENKIYLRKLKKIFEKIKKFSLHHGSDFPATHKKKKKIKIKLKNIFPILFTNSNVEKQYYKLNFILDHNPKFLGCPKHDETWLNFINQKKKTKLFNDGYVLLVSRNVDNDYLPSKRKINYLKIIKQNILDKGLKIIIKLHPKEDSESGKNFYFKIFEKENFNKSWKFSKDMPMQLSIHAKFVITFFSGVAVDMCAQKKSTIELLDLKGLENKANPFDLFYEKYTNEPVFRVRKYGFVYGTSNEKEFQNRVNWVINNEKKSNEKFYKHFTKLYSKNKKATQNVYNYILENI